MTRLLVILTVAEVLLVVVVLAVYVINLTRELRSISTVLGKVAFGVRAVETQTGAIGPAVTRINGTLGDIEQALGPIAEKARQAASSR